MGLTALFPLLSLGRTDKVLGVTSSECLSGRQKGVEGRGAVSRSERVRRPTVFSLFTSQTLERDKRLREEMAKGYFM